MYLAEFCKGFPGLGDTVAFDAGQRKTFHVRPYLFFSPPAFGYNFLLVR